MNYKSIFRHYWKFASKRIPEQIVAFGAIAIASLFTSGFVPLLYKYIIDDVSGASQKFSIETLLITLVVSIFMYNIFYRMSDYFLITVQSKILKDLSDYSLAKVKVHSYSFFSSAFTGALIAKSKRFVNAFETIHDTIIFQVWMNGLSLVISVTVLWYQNWILGAVFLIWIISYGVLVKFLVRWQIPKSLENASADSLTTAQYSDILTNILTIKMFGTDEREQRNFEKVTHNQEVARSKAWLQQSFWNSMFQATSVGLFEIAIMTVSIVLWKKGLITPGIIVLVQIYAARVFAVVWNISRSVVKVTSSLSDADEMVEIFDKVPGILDVKNPQSLTLESGVIQFDNVTFKYENNENVFDKLNLTILPGERIALVGHSGAGKTTFVKILLRFIDIQGGTISIDGQDISKVTQDELRRHIAYVPQDPSLFHRTLRENIAYAKPDATDEEIIAVAKRAHAHEFIDSLPEKYNSLVGERGIKLSGGERQRIAIARAMLKDAPIIVLDEATSALDSISEGKIQEAFAELMKGKTTIVIAHRLSTIRGMDRIVVFDKGAIAETGTHNQLLKKKGIYAELWNSQVGGFISE